MTMLDIATNEPVLDPGFVLIGVILGIVLYLYSAYCLYHIAKKTNTENEWLAWIPLANIYLMVKIARLPVWLLLGFLLAPIPWLNLLTIVLIGYIWWKIAEERRRPGWWGLLMIISPLNLIILWLLAFKEAENQLVSVNTPPSNPNTV